MYLTDITMQLISTILVLFIGVYFFMFIFSFYRREKRRTREQDTKRYTFEYCAKEIKKLDKYIRVINSEYETRKNNSAYEERENAYFYILSIFECLAVGVYTEVLTEEVVVLYFGSYMRSFYMDNRLNLFRMRESENNVGLYANYERFMEEWDFRQEDLKSLKIRRR